jgi:hypothetical protein
VPKKIYNKNKIKFIWKHERPQIAKAILAEMSYGGGNNISLYLFYFTFLVLLICVYII